DESGALVWEDLSGTIVRWSRPVAMYGGNVSTFVFNKAAYAIMEMIPPTSQLGTKFALVHEMMEVPNDNEIERRGLSPIRVVAAHGDIEVLIDGALRAVVDSGAVYRTIIALCERARWLETITLAVLIEVASGTSGDAYGHAEGWGDPF